MFIIHLALYLITGICAIYITWKAFQTSVGWGLFFLFSGVVFWALSTILGTTIAGLAVIAMMIAYVKDHWDEVGAVFTLYCIVWGIRLLLS